MTGFCQVFRWGTAVLFGLKFNQRDKEAQDAALQAEVAVRDDNSTEDPFLFAVRHTAPLAF